MFEVRLAPESQSIIARIWFPDPGAQPLILKRIAQVLGIDSPAAAAVEQLSADPVLGPLVAQRPGLRVPGAWDPFEIAVRAVTGQQVSLKAATAMVARAARLCGTPLTGPNWSSSGLSRLFPLPEQLAAADLFDVGMPQARMTALRSLAAVAATDPNLFENTENRRRRLQAQPGIGDWTAQYIAMRALRDPDAFPAADVVIRRMLTEPGGTRPTPAAVVRRAEAWRPYRSLATIHLWTAAALAAKPNAHTAIAGS